MNHGSQQNFMQIPVLGFRAEASATAPSSPVAGQHWTDTSVSPNVVRWYDGSSWVAANYTGIANGYVTNAMLAGSIALSKLATDPLARANHTGTQTASTISDFDTQVRTSRLDQMAVPTAAVNFNGQRASNGADPTSALDYATKQYVDNARQGVAVKDPVIVAAQANVTLAAPGTTVDGVTLSTGDRFLAPVQSTGTQNGVYVFNGSAAAATRAPDADATGEVIDGTLVAVAQGTDAGKQYIQTATASGAPGAWTQSWTIFSTGGQTYSAGTGLALAGQTFSLSTPVSVANGGTNATTAAAARTSLGTIGRYAADLGALTGGVSATITHNLGSSDVGVWFRTNSDNRVLDLDWAPTSTNVVTVYPDLSYTAAALRVVVVG